MIPSEKQKKVIKCIKNAIQSWEATNDLKSPTHDTDFLASLDAIADEIPLSESQIVSISVLVYKLNLDIIAIERKEVGDE